MRAACSTAAAAIGSPSLTSRPRDEIDRAVGDLRAAEHAVVRAPLLDDERVVAGGAVQPPPAALDVAVGAIALDRADAADVARQLARRGAALVEREPDLTGDDRLRRI